MDYRKESLRLHGEWKGKIEVNARAKVNDKDSLSLAYTPGVAEPCLAIKDDYKKSWELTRRWNMVAVITDGTAVLGLGDIGPEAGMPVMEGKCVLFKEFGDVDAFPLCVRTKDVENVWMGSATGTPRVQNVRIYNKKTGAYEPLDLNRTYALAGMNYTLRNLGDGFAMFDGAELIKDYVSEDYLVMSTYAMIFDAVNDVPVLPRVRAFGAKP